MTRKSALQLNNNKILFKDQLIGRYDSSSNQAHLNIRPTTLVKDGWTRRLVVELYRRLPRLIRKIRNEGYYVHGGLWFPNLDEKTFNAFYDSALAALKLEEPKRMGKKNGKAKKTGKDLLET